MNDLLVSPVLRAARGAVTAVVAGGLGVAAHVAGGGNLPSAAWMTAIVLALGSVCIASMGRPAGLLRLVVLVGGGQFATHLVLTASAGHGGGHPSRGPALVQSMPSTDVGAGRRGSLRELTEVRVEPDAGGDLVVPHWFTHVVSDLTGPNAAMALAHLAAAGVVAWWLAQGERALWTVLVLVGWSVAHALLRVTVRSDCAAVVEPEVGPWSVGAQRPSRLRNPLAGGLGRRGPPLTAI